MIYTGFGPSNAYRFLSPKVLCWWLADFWWLDGSRGNFFQFGCLTEGPQEVTGLDLVPRSDPQYNQYGFIRTDYIEGRQSVCSLLLSASWPIMWQSLHRFGHCQSSPNTKFRGLLILDCESPQLWPQISSCPLLGIFKFPCTQESKIET